MPNPIFNQNAISNERVLDGEPMTINGAINKTFILFGLLVAASWIVWDLFLVEASKRSKFIKKTMDALLTLFTLRYSTGCQKKRRNILYFAISLLCENLINNEEIMRPSQQEIVSNIFKKIDLVYKQIKKNEESTGTEYLFKDVKSFNLEKTIEKLEKMNSFGENFVPRI